jgi:hypothetical protein
LGFGKLGLTGKAQKKQNKKREKQLKSFFQNGTSNIVGKYLF